MTTHHRITNVHSGFELGIFEGATPWDSYRAMLDDAGDFEDQELIDAWEAASNWLETTDDDEGTVSIVIDEAGEIGWRLTEDVDGRKELGIVRLDEGPQVLLGALLEHHGIEIEAV